MKWIKKKVLKSYKGWNSFWFGPLDTINLACFRFCFCLVLLGMYLIRFSEIRLFFYESGLISSSKAKALHHMMHPDKLFNFMLPSDMWLYLCYLLFIVVLLLMVLGVHSRILAGVAFVLHILFLQRNPTIIFGADMVATFWLFYLILAHTPKQLRWLYYFSHKRKGLISDSPRGGGWLSTIAVRFIQIQLAVIYMFSGLEKLKGSSWWEGTAIWEALSFYDFTLVDFSFLLAYPLLAGVLTAFTILFEIYFPVLVWVPKLRKMLLLAGLLLHIGIALALNIYFFSLIMLSAYILFIPPEALRKLLRKL